MLRIFLLSLCVIALSPFVADAQGWDPRETAELSAKTERNIQAARDTAAELLKTDATLKAFFDEAYGYAVFPKAQKTGFLVGGGRSSGILFKGDTPYKRAYMTQYTAGLQIGRKSFSQIIFFRDRDAFDRFDYGEFAPNSQVYLASQDVGRGTVWEYANDVAIFIIDKGGFMMDISTGGQNFGTRELQ